jgi:hypothetical protein
LAPATAEPSPARWKLLTQTPYVDIYENGRPLPRAWLSSETRVLNESAMLEVIRNARFADGTNWDPATTGLIEAPLAGDVRPQSQGTAQIVRYEPNRIDVSTKADGPSLLVLGENHYPGWRTYVDGRAVDTLRVDYNLRGAVLPAGEHLVEFSYQPKSLLIGTHVRRYASADDFGMPESAFNVCTFWYVDALASIGRREEAREIFEGMLACRTSLGLLSEDVDARTNELWGNFPQTYSMVGIINSAMRLSRSWEDAV